MFLMCETYFIIIKTFSHIYNIKIILLSPDLWLNGFQIVFYPSSNSRKKWILTLPIPPPLKKKLFNIYIDIFLILYVYLL